MRYDPRDDESSAPKWRRYLRLLRPDPAADLDDELHDHLQSAIDGLVARGMTESDARREAIRRFGDVARVRRQVAAVDAGHRARANRLAMLETLLYDLRHAARALRRSPVFTLVAATSIALGVAANATVFSIVNATLLRPIPGTHAPRLERVYVNHHSPLDWTTLQWMRDHTRSFEQFVGERYLAAGFRASSAAEPERIHASYVTRGFFPALGVRLALGRAFDADEVRDAAAPPVGVISHAFWQRRFAGDSSFIGREVFVSGHAVTIVGVAAPEFRSSVMSWVPDLFLPLAVAPVITGEALSDFGGSFYTVAQLRPNVDAGPAEAEMHGVLAQLAKTDSARFDGITLRLDHTRGVNAEARVGVAAGSVFLMAIVAMVLLIACANVANLLMGRAAARRVELGVRLAIGASRGRLVRQLLTESLLLATLGGAAGFATAWVVTRALPAFLPAEAGIDATYFQPDAVVVAFTALLCLGTTLLFGMVPALRATSPHLVGLLKGEGARSRRRGALVTVQVALCVLLLAVASLFVRSLASARSVDPGFRPDGVIDANVDLNLLGRGSDKPAVLESIRRDAMTLPGVESATLAGVVPLSGSNMETRITPEGLVTRTARDAPQVYFNIVAPRYFTTLRTPVLRGREFLESDRAASGRVAVVNETAARRLWPDAEAIGKRFKWDDDSALFEVVGVTRDANYVMPGESPKPTVYMALAQVPRGEMTLMLRTTADLPTVRKSVWSLLHDRVPTLPPPPVVQMSDDMAVTLLPVRLGAMLLGAFGILALVLAGAGIYGVASYSVPSRTREIGIRAALGASRGRLVRMILWENGRRVMLGGGIGLALTIAIATLLGRLLYGVRPIDPMVLGFVAGTIGLVAIVATIAPARRAARADPVTAMRAE